jgi:hypothetical protein
MLGEGSTASDISSSLNIHKSHISYYIKRLNGFGYIREVCRDVFKLYELTQAGMNFVTMYENKDSMNICRAENIRFKAHLKSLPVSLPNGKKVKMNHWDKYCIESNGIKIHFNIGKEPTVEFLPGPIDGTDPKDMQNALLQDCIEASQELEKRLNIRMGRLQESSKGE